MSSKRFPDLQIYQLAERLSDEIWEIVNEWEYWPSLNILTAEQVDKLRLVLKGRASIFRSQVEPGNEVWEVLPPARCE